jgi:hypothetical protein
MRLNRSFVLLLFAVTSVLVTSLYMIINGLLIVWMTVNWLVYLVFMVRVMLPVSLIGRTFVVYRVSLSMVVMSSYYLLRLGYLEVSVYY